MRIAVSSNTKGIEGNVSDIFGRCPFFVVAEIENNEIKSVESFENVSACQAGGAGISAAEFVAGKNADALITGNIGPRAMQVFRQFNIKVYAAAGKTQQAIKDLLENKLERIV